MGSELLPTSVAEVGVTRGEREMVTPPLVTTERAPSASVRPLNACLKPFAPKITGPTDRFEFWRETGAATCVFKVSLVDPGVRLPSGSTIRLLAKSRPLRCLSLQFPQTSSPMGRMFPVVV